MVFLLNGQYFYDHKEGLARYTRSVAPHTSCELNLTAFIANANIFNNKVACDDLGAGLTALGRMLGGNVTMRSLGTRLPNASMVNGVTYPIYGYIHKSWAAGGVYTNNPYFDAKLPSGAPANETSHEVPIDALVYQDTNPANGLLDRSWVINHTFVSLNSTKYFDGTFLDSIGHNLVLVYGLWRDTTTMPEKNGVPITFNGKTVIFAPIPVGTNPITVNLTDILYVP
ncbi:MAG: hypothetical protein R3F19_13020 [Verrucomicrobiales bacterium]